jgi:hypothetical protein
LVGEQEHKLINIFVCPNAFAVIAHDGVWLDERLGSGDGERKTLLTRQIAFEPLPASVLFALGCGWSLLMLVKME